MQRILVPTDFSKYASNALEFAAQVARKSGGEILLTHILDFPVGSTYSMMGEFASVESTHEMVFKLQESAKENFKEIVDDQKYKNLKINYDIKIGNPFESIAKEISNYNADLVIMGTKGCNGIEEMVIGSNAEKVVRFAKCPVITVSDYFDISGIKIIVFGLDPDHCPKFVIKKLEEYQHLFDAELKLVWVNTIHVIEDEEVIRNKIQNFVEELKLKNYTIDSYRSVYAENGIFNYSNDVDANLIALATHGRRGLAHLFTGSLAEDIANHAKCPVWTYSLKAEK